MLNILLVEDDAAHATLIQEAFTRHARHNGAVQLTVAGSLAEARARLARSVPDLVIADLRLPDGDSVKLLPADAEGVAYPVVIMTSQGDEQAAVEAMKAGALDYVVKSNVTMTQMPRIAGRAMREWEHIAKRREAEEALRKSEVKYAKVFHSSPHSITISALPSGRLVEVNDHFLEVTGYRREDVIGRTPVELNLWVDPAKRARFIELVQEQGVVRNEEVAFRLGPDRVLTCLVSGERMDLSGEPCMVAITRNITERKQIEETLRYSEERLKLLFEYAPDAYYLNDLKGVFVDGNRAAEELIGYKREELIGKSFLRANLLPPQQIPKAMTLLASNALRKSTGPDDFILKRKDGERVSVEIRTYPVKIQGQTLVLGIAHDVTQRKRTEAALREQKERFRTLFDNSPDAIFVEDLDGYVLDVNPAACRLHRTRRERLIGQHIEALVPPEQRPHAMEEFNRLAEGAVDYIKGYSQTKNGRAVPVELRARRIMYAGKSAIVLHVRDVTRRKQAEEELQRYRDQLEELVEKRTTELQQINRQLRQEIAERERVEAELKREITERKQAEKALQFTQFSVDQAGDAIFWVDQDARFVYVNEQACRSLGYSRDELLSMAVHNVDAELPAAFWPATWESIKRSGFSLFESRYRTKAGEMIPVEVTINYLNFDGQEHHCVYARNITERKRAQEELWAYRDHLEDLVEERTAELRQTNQQLLQEIAERGRAEEDLKREIAERERLEEQIRRHNEELEHLVEERTERIQELERQRAEGEKLVATGRMAAGIAHEINNPLASIMSSFELVKTSVSADHPRYDYVERIEEDLDRVARIIRHMYNLYKPVQEEAQTFEVHTVLDEIQTLLEPYCHQRGVTLIVTADAARRPVHLPPTSIHQVLSNIVRNAIDASLPGKTVKVIATTDANSLSITVIDQGSGIPETIQKQIFEPFFTSKQNGGMGLGLAIAQSLVGAMGGIITFRSRPGTGTTFDITLPLRLEVTDDDPSVA